MFALYKDPVQIFPALFLHEPGKGLFKRKLCGTLLYLYGQQDIRAAGCRNEFRPDCPIDPDAFYITVRPQIIFIYRLQCPGIGYFIFYQGLRFVDMSQGNIRKSGLLQYGSVKWYMCSVSPMCKQDFQRLTPLGPDVVI